MRGVDGLDESGPDGVFAELHPGRFRDFCYEKRSNKSLLRVSLGAPSRGRTGTPLLRKAADFKSIDLFLLINYLAAIQFRKIRKTPSASCCFLTRPN